MENMDLDSKLKYFSKAVDRIYGEIDKVVVGQKDVIKLMLVTLFSRGHGIFIGVPGVGKTLIVSTLSDVLDLNFNRIQFTPDLLPSDILGTEIIEEDVQSGKKAFKFIKGPVFTNILLADEINRTPPKTQSALLEAMQEKNVTVGGESYMLDLPFHVFATQNPIEQEGTYPLPEAQLDRFLLQIDLDYPDFQDEKKIIELTTTKEKEKIEVVMNPSEILDFQKMILHLPLSEPVLSYITKVTRETRPRDSSVDLVKEFVEYGAGPRGGQALSLASKVIAAMDGRPSPSIEDVKKIAVAALKHRIILNFKGHAEGIILNDIIEAVLKKVSL